MSEIRNIYICPPCAAANYLKKCTCGSRGPREACGKLGHYSGAVTPTEAYWRWDVLGGADGFGTLCAGLLATWTEFQYRKQYLIVCCSMIDNLL